MASLPYFLSLIGCCKVPTARESEMRQILRGLKCRTYERIAKCTRLRSTPPTQALAVGQMQVSKMYDPMASEDLAEISFCCEVDGPFARHRCREEYLLVCIDLNEAGDSSVHSTHHHENDVIACGKKLHPISTLKWSQVNTIGHQQMK